MRAASSDPAADGRGPRPTDAAPASAVSGPAPTLLWMLLAAMGVGPLFNYGLSAASPLVIERLGVSSGLLGTVLSVVFAAAALTSVALGRAADRLTARVQMAVLFGGSAASLAIGAVADTLGGLYAAAALAGATQALSNPTTNRVIRSVVPADRRIGWIGVKQSGVQAAQLFAGLFFPAAGLVLGWTGASLAVAGLAAALGVVAVVTAPVLPEAASGPGAAGLDAPGPDGAEGQSGVPGAGRPEPGRDGTRLPAIVWVFSAIAFLTGLGMQATNMYLPLFAVEALDVSLVVGGAAAAASGVVGVVSRIWWGRRMSAGHRPATLLTWITAGAIAGVAVLLAADLWHATALLWLGAFVHGLTVLGVNVVTNAGLMDAVPSARLGRASGVNAMGMYAGFACGPAVMGLLRDLTGDFRAGFVAVGVAYAAALAVALLLGRRGSRA